MLSDKITSLTNLKVKHIVQLRTRKQRKEDGLTIVEGMREITRALQGGVTFHALYMCLELIGDLNVDTLIETLTAYKIPVYDTTPAVFEKMAYGNRSEGVLAVCAPKPCSFEDLQTKKGGLFVVVESVEKPGNLGAILRTCDGAGVDGVIICDGKTDIYNPNVIRASLGAIFSVKVAVGSNEEALEFLRSNNIAVCATLPAEKNIYTNATLTGPLAVVVGSEQDGLTDFWAGNADLRVRIPMNGQVDSLNVSTSTAVLLYETIRQRNQ